MFSLIYLMVGLVTLGFQALVLHRWVLRKGALSPVQRAMLCAAVPLLWPAVWFFALRVRSSPRI